MQTTDSQAHFVIVQNQKATEHLSDIYERNENKLVVSLNRFLMWIENKTPFVNNDFSRVVVTMNGDSEQADYYKISDNNFVLIFD